MLKRRVPQSCIQQQRQREKKLRGGSCHSPAPAMTPLGGNRRPHATSAERLPHRARGRRGDGHNPHEEFEFELERLAAKFCACLYGQMRMASRHTRGELSEGVLKNRLVVRMYDVPLTHANIGTNVAEVTASATWRRMRDRLEAVSALSVLACTKSYSWRHNQPFWQRFVDDRDRQRPREQPSNRKYSNPSSNNNTADLIPAPRDDSILPRFVLDFAFAELTVEIVTLIHRVLLGSVKSMRVNYLKAMASLATVPSRFQQPVVISIGLCFARCTLAASHIIPRIVALVQEVEECFVRRDRSTCSNATSSVFYFRIEELDFGGIQFSPSDLLALRPLSRYRHLRIVLDGAVSRSADQLVPFGALVESWFEQGPRQPQPYHERLEPSDEEPEAEPSICCEPWVAGAVDVSLNSCTLTCSHVGSLFSAIRGGGLSRVNALSLRSSFQWCESSVAWAWVAYGVWCDGSTSPLVALDLSHNSISERDVEIVKQVVAASSQEARANVMYDNTVVRGNATTNTPKKTTTSKKIKKKAYKPKNATSGHREEKRAAHTSGSMVRVAGGTRVKFANASPAEDRTFVWSADVTSQVVQVADGALALIVPGYGVVFVDSSTATQVDDTVAAEARTPSMLQELSMNEMRIHEDETTDSVFRSLFTSIALPSLLKLELNCNPIGPGALQAVLLACPSLKTLSLEACELKTIAPLVARYEQGTCHIETLNLPENQIGGRDIVALCRLMRRSASPASRIRSLDLDENPIGYHGLHALVAVVRETHTLAKLVLAKSQDPDASFRRAFYPFDDQPMGVEALSDAHKRAFCNALSARCTTEALDEDIIQRICELAGSFLHRRVVWQ